MKKLSISTYIFFIACMVAPVMTLAFHQMQYENKTLSAKIISASYCNQSASASATFSDEPSRLLYSVSAGGTLVRDDVFSASLTVNGVDSDLYRYGNCGCGDGCSGTDTLNWLTFFQDSGAPITDSVTISGSALEKFKPSQGRSDVGFSGYNILAVWRVCDPRQITKNGVCRDISGSLSANQTSCSTPCLMTISPNWQFANDVKMYRNGVSTISYGPIMPDPDNPNAFALNYYDILSDAGTFTYQLKGKDGFGTEYVLDSVTVSVSSRPPPECSPVSQSVGINSPVTINAREGTSVFSWSAPGGAPSSGSGSEFITSYDTPGTKTVTVTSGESANCTVIVSEDGPDPSLVDIKIDGTDGPLIVPAGKDFTISWGAKGGGTPNYSDCTASGNWSGSKQPGGSVLGTTLTNQKSTILAYTITCTSPVNTPFGVGFSTSDSVSVVVSGREDNEKEECSLSVNPSSVPVFGSAWWTITSNPSYFPFFWRGTDNGVDIGRIPGGNTNRLERFTYNYIGDYVRYAEVEFPEGTCTTNRVSFSVSGGPGGGPGGGGGGNQQVSCAVSESGTFPNKTFTATASGLPNGYSYNWIVRPPVCNQTQSNNTNMLTVNCGSTTGSYEVEASSGINAGLKGVCSFSNCPPGGCVPEDPSDPVIVQLATNGKSDQTGNWQSALTGQSPLLSVDIMGIYPGATDRYKFDCNSDGIYEAERPSSVPDYRGVAEDLCNYYSLGTYTVTVVALQGYAGNACRNTGVFCRELGVGTARITVAPPPQGFNFDGAYWHIQSGTTRYRADYDYDNNGILNKLDMDVIPQVVVGRRSCPQNKNCDIDGSGNIRSADTVAYIRYLETYEVPLGSTAARSVRAGLYLSNTTGGATVNLTSSAPSGNSIVPSSIIIPAGRSNTAELRLPVLPLGTYAMTATGVAGGGTTKTSNTITLRVTSGIVPPPPTPDFGLSSSRDVFANIIGTGRIISNPSRIAVNAFGGFNQIVALSVQSITPSISGATFNFTKNSLLLSDYISGADFTISIPPNTSAGLYTAIVRGVAGGTTRTTSVQFRVGTRDPSFKEI